MFYKTRFSKTRTATPCGRKRTTKLISIGLTVLLSLAAYIPQVSAATSDYILYSVVSGDTLWKIGNRYSVSVSSIQSINNISGTMIYPGQKLMIPVASPNAAQGAEIVHTVVSGDTLWKLSNYYNVDLNELMNRNNMNYSTVIYPGQKIYIPAKSPSSSQTSSGSTEPYITYESYTVQSGDTIWSISQKFGVSQYELMKVNGFNENTWLTIGQKIQVPVHHVPVTPVPGPQYGEYLDWWTQAQYVFPINKTATVTDFYTGKSWQIKRVAGANHADVEPLTAADTAVMKSVFGGSWSWTYRPVIVTVDGRKIAASMAGMPHAGLDAYPADQSVSNRSGDYGYGPNYDYVKGNNMDGHVDLHFKNSTTHNTGKVVDGHQNNIKIAAGVK